MGYKGHRVLLLLAECASDSYRRRMSHHDNIYGPELTTSPYTSLAMFHPKPVFRAEMKYHALICFNYFFSISHYFLLSLPRSPFALEIIGYGKAEGSTRILVLVSFGCKDFPTVLLCFSKRAQSCTHPYIYLR